MLHLAQNLLLRTSPKPPVLSLCPFDSSTNSIPQITSHSSQPQNHHSHQNLRRRHSFGASASRPSLSIWRRKKEMSKEGLIVAKQLKRLRSDPLRLDRFIRTHVSRLLKSDLVSVLVELQREDQIFLSMKLYDVVRKEIWYRPDMFFYRDMLMMLARNKKVDEAKRVWEDLKRVEVLFDQDTFGDLVRAFLDNGLTSEAIDIYDNMRQYPDPPISLPFWVYIKGAHFVPGFERLFRAFPWYDCLRPTRRLV